MRIIEVDTKNRSATTEFHQLPFKLYRNSPQWVPPLAHEARRQLNRDKNPYFNHSEALFLLAYDHKDQPVGRLAILDNHNYNEFHKAQTAFFFLFECEDNLEISTWA